MNIRITAGVLILLIVLVCGCSEPGTTSTQPDSQAIEANNRGVGLMGRFEYSKAQAVFSELASDWPDWHDVRLNLAIATLNLQRPGGEIETLDLAREVLSADPGNLRAHYVAGLVQLYLGFPEEAAEHFEFVANKDANDAHAAYYLAQSLAQQADYEQAITWYQRAMQLDPYLRSAYYGAFQTLQRLKRPQEAGAIAADYQRLEDNPRSYLAEFKYTRMGPKGGALTVDLETEPSPALPKGALFEQPEPVSISGTDARRWRPLLGDRTTSITTVDMQDDGLADLFVAGVFDATSDRGEAVAGNLVLQGQAGGGYAAIENHALAAVSNVNAALWGDYDNDGLVDVYLCRRGANQLWRQTEADTWQDVTATTRTSGADLDTVDGGFFDADHDGDLDLFLVNGDGPNELLNNNLDGTFRPLAQDQGLAGSSDASIMVVPADIDNDRDADLIVLNRTPPHDVYTNDRLWSYRPAAGFESFNKTAAMALLAEDIDADGMAELYSVDADGTLLRWQAGADGRFQPESLSQPEVLKDVSQAQLAAFDVNGDGTLELIVSSARGWTVLATNGSALESSYSVASPDQDFVASVPFIGQSTSGPSMLALSAGNAGLSIWKPGPGRYPFVTLALSGRQDAAQSMRSNASGIGTRLAVRAGSRWSLLQTYRNDSAPGQSLQSLAVGLNGDRRADFIAIDWSDGVFQSEVNVATGELQRISETQRQLSSCPVLFAWNGTEYAFVSDFLGVGGLGYAVGPGEYATPRPRENFLMPDGSLQSKNGRYELKIAEPMEENAYVDAARLAIYDLPPGWQMVLDERMGIAGPQPTGEALFYRWELLPQRALNDRGEDVLASILKNDGIAAPVGALDTRFIGRLQDEHILTLDFAQPLDGQAGAPILVADGWVEYPYSQTNFAAWQAGAAYEAPTLEAFAGGEWHRVLEQFGYPAGMPRRMALPLQALPPGTTSLRLRSNMQIYWDRIAVAFAEELPQHKKQLMPVADARMNKTGFALRSNLDQFRPHYDYTDMSPFWDTRYMSGFYTRLGPVTELVTDVDDAVAIIGPGEEVHLEFDAATPAADGWRRYFVLETNGWAKDMDLYTRDGATVGPLPSTGKPAALRDRLHEQYNTRYQSGF
ncbi:MAG: VCBS repeat-containing protein [Gammaproteobacteria bacterium]|nr:VCBS repeat-containing protein [Gammaproteobacteria bacterium]NNL46699.1 tetratricopeptide repeat protein [Woeseiaceae bacterium]